MTVSFEIFDGPSGVVSAEMLSQLQALSFQGATEHLWSCDDMSIMFGTMGAKAIVISQGGQIPQGSQIPQGGQIPQGSQISQGGQISQGAKPIGFVMWRTVLDEAEILTICIVPSWRCQGFGSYMLKILFDTIKANGVMQVFLEVNEHNKAAIMLYEKNGFDVVGRRKDYYGAMGEKKQDALVMKYLG